MSLNNINGTHKDNDKFHSSISHFNVLDNLIDSLPSTINLVYDKKSNDLSRSFREQGNKLFINSSNVQWQEIIQLYTKSLFSAESNEEKSLSYGNRSSVLFRQELYEQCLVDIELCLKAGYPNDKISKILLRKSEALLYQNKFNEAAASFNNILSSNISIDKITQEKIQSGLNSCESRIKNVSIHNMNNYHPDSLHLSEEVYNKEIDCFSNKVEIKYSDIDGRGVFAKENISVGDILAVETPFTTKLVNSEFYSHCYRCMKLSFNLIPCEDCCKIGYCSDECASLNTAEHSKECGYLSEILSTPNEDMALLAYSALCKVDYQQIADKVNLFTENYDALNHWSNQDQYHNTFGIVTNWKHRSQQDLNDRCKTALFLARCFIHKNPEFCQTADRKSATLVLAKALSQHLQGISCNAHCINETHIHPTDDHQTQQYIFCYSANAIYPAMSLLNHSCSPNVLRVTQTNGRCLLLALCPIRQNEQLYDNYSLHFATHSLEQRQQQLLSQYMFQCKCQACCQQWSLFEDQLQQDNQLKFHENTSPESIAELRKLHEQLPTTMTQIMQGDITNEMMQFLQRFMSLTSEMVILPHLLFNQVSEMLKMLYNLKFGIQIVYQ